jgi:hypothetical protein
VNFPHGQDVILNPVDRLKPQPAPDVGNRKQSKMKNELVVRRWIGVAFIRKTPTEIITEIQTFASKGTSK